jgi:hypothetical protein
MPVVNVQCRKCGKKYPVEISEVPVDNGNVKDICPECGDDDWKGIAPIHSTNISQEIIVSDR